MGRSRKPTEILNLTGRLAHDGKRFADRKGEPVKNAKLGGPPDRLEATERELWVEIKTKLVPGVALQSDAEAFEILVGLIARYRRKAITQGESGMLLKLLSVFGMTPADRSRVSAEHGAAEAEDEWGELKKNG